MTEAQPTNEQVEAVARAIEPEIYADYDAVARDCPQFLPTYSGSALLAKARAKARAAITACEATGWAAVIEEAARVAEAKYADDRWAGHYRIAGHSIATAIRALASDRVL